MASLREFVDDTAGRPWTTTERVEVKLHVLPRLLEALETLREMADQEADRTCDGSRFAWREALDIIKHGLGVG